MRRVSWSRSNVGRAAVNAVAVASGNIIVGPFWPGAMTGQWRTARTIPRGPGAASRVSSISPRPSRPLEVGSLMIIGRGISCDTAGHECGSSAPSSPRPAPAKSQGNIWSFARDTRLMTPALPVLLFVGPPSRPGRCGQRHPGRRVRLYFCKVPE